MKKLFLFLTIYSNIFALKFTTQHDKIQIRFYFLHSMPNDDYPINQVEEFYTTAPFSENEPYTILKNKFLNVTIPERSYSISLYSIKINEKIMKKLPAAINLQKCYEIILTENGNNCEFKEVEDNEYCTIL